MEKLLKAQPQLCVNVWSFMEVKRTASSCQALTSVKAHVSMQQLAEGSAPYAAALTIAGRANVKTCCHQHVVFNQSMPTLWQPSRA